MPASKSSKPRSEFRSKRRSEPAPAPRRYHHGALRESLLDVAAAWLDGHGAATLTLRELAKAAGVSHAAPYHHFTSLDDLLAGVAERAFVRLGAALAQASREARSPAHRLLDIGEAYVLNALAHPAQFRLMFGPTLARKMDHPGLRVAAEQAFDIVAQAGLAYSPDDGLELALTGWSLSHGAANLLIDGAFDGLPPGVIATRNGASTPMAAAALVRRMVGHLLRPDDARGLA